MGATPAMSDNQALSLLLDAIARAIAGLRVMPIPQYAKITTAETTTSGAAADLATVGPFVQNVTVGVSGAVIVSLSARISNSGANYSETAVEVSGATTRAVQGSEAITLNGANVMRFGRTYVIDGLTPGLNHFKMKYYVSAGTGTFGDRYLVITPI